MQVWVQEQQCSTQVSTVVDTSFTEECVDAVEQLLAHVAPGHAVAPIAAAAPVGKGAQKLFKTRLGLNIDNRSQMQQAD